MAAFFSTCHEEDRMFSTEEQSRVLATLRDAQRAAFEKIKEYLDAPHGGSLF